MRRQRRLERWDRWSSVSNEEHVIPNARRGSGTRQDEAAIASPGELEAIAARVATSAAELVRSRLGRSHVLDTKTTLTDVVTQADLETEEHIRLRLQDATPGADFHGEERGQTDGDTRIGWIVDPIDGTVNYVYDLPVVAVSIAATVDGEVTAGAVADVLRAEVFSASVGNGARRNGVRIGPSSTNELGKALIGTGFSYSADARRDEGAIAARILPAARDIRCFGSAALNLCWVACGRLDGYYQRDVKSWDMAAGALIALEAGAGVEPAGDPDGELVIAATPGVFGSLRKVVED